MLENPSCSVCSVYFCILHLCSCLILYLYFYLYTVRTPLFLPNLILLFLLVHSTHSETNSLLCLYIAPLLLFIFMLILIRIVFFIYLYALQSLPSLCNFPFCLCCCCTILKTLYVVVCYPHSKDTTL